MGDGGVACMPLHQSIMDRLSIPEKAHCGGGVNNGKNGFNNNNSSPSSSVKVPESRTKKKMKKVKRIVKRVVTVKKKGVLKSEVAALETKEKINGNKVEKKSDDLGADDKVVVQNDEVEEGELGTLKWPAREAENGELSVPEKLKRGGSRGLYEKGEISVERWRKGDSEKEYTHGNWRRGEVEKGEFRSWRGYNDEVERGEFVPDRWHRGEVSKDDYSGYSKSSRRYEQGKNKGWKHEFERSPPWHTPPSGRFQDDEGYYRKKEYGKNANHHSKNPFSRWEGGLERILPRLGPKVTNEDGSHRVEYSNGKSQVREHFLGNRLKRHSYDADSDSSERGDRKQYSDYADYASSKSRRLSDEGNHSFHSEHYSHRSGERHYKNSSSRVSSSDKLSSRQHEYSLPSRGAYDRHGRSPVSSDRSPRGRSRHYEHRDRSPRYERSPYSRDRSPYVHGRTLYGRDRSPFGRERSPYGRDGTPYGRDGTPYSRERSPYGRDRSPYERNYRYDYRNKSPTYAERSTQEHRHSDRKDQNQNNVERSPHEQGKPQERETSRKADSGKISSQPRSRVEEEKPKQKEQNGKETNISVTDAQERGNDHDIVAPAGVEKDTSSQSQKEDLSQSQTADCKESPHVDVPVPEEMQSMEEDMDISDTPPHVPAVADMMRGRWVYLDYFGVERGPSKLCDLKVLVDDGVLAPDHFIKHLDTDRWVTVQNAASPLVTLNFTSIASDDITQLVNPPEAPGNLLEDIGDASQSGVERDEERQEIPELETVGDFCIDKRVEALLEGVHSAEGAELEAVGEALQMTFENEQWEKCQNVEEFIWHQACSSEHCTVIKDEVSTRSSTELREGVNCDREVLFVNSDFSEWCNGQLSCKGGDWKRNEETALDRSLRKKLVLNDGFPLCQMTKSGYEDPRWHEKEELYQPSFGKRLDLPPWAYSLQDERIDMDGLGRTQVKPAVMRGVKGTVLSVVRINACVVRDNGSFVSENRSKVWGKDRHSSRSARPYSSSSDVRRSSAEGSSRSKTADEHNLHNLRKSALALNIPKDRVCTVQDLQLHLGDWYFVDGAGHERGPLSFSELQVLADQGIVPNHSSVFRKLDRLWIPISSAGETSKVADNVQLENNLSSASSAGPQLRHTQVAPLAETRSSDSSFHRIHPQFIGFMRGKLHELVMRSYKSREFAAAINEVLDPWITARQPKKEMEKLLYRKSDIDFRAGKRARIDESEEDSERDEDLQNIKRNEASFEDLCGGASFSDHSASSGLLDGQTLARVFHFLRSDLKTLATVSITCKQWRAAVRFYKDISREIDVSSLGPSCINSVLKSIVSGYDKEKINALILKDCSNITSDMLEEILQTFPCLSYIDIRGCSQFGDLSCRYPNINWVRSRNTFGDARTKSGTLKQLSEKNSAWSATKVVGRKDTDEFSELKDYFDSVDRRDAAGQAFRRGFYKRSKLFDARKASSILSRDARLRRWSIKNSENGYKRMEEFLVLSLKEIMKENTFDFFVPKVAEIQDRLKSGYYIRRGISSVKEDISRICRDAIKAKNRGDAGDMNRIVKLFIQLASQLEESSKSSFQRDGIKSWKDDTSGGLSTSSRIKKKLVKADNDRKYRSNGSSFSSGGYDDGDYTSDQEIRRHLSKLNKKSLDSESETSDGTGGSFEYSKSDSETTVSETESDSEFRGQAADSRANSFASVDEGLDSFVDDREWGARMTKVSLVPPVTRKYEVIDEYIIVADEDEVRRRMQVSLPEDYAEKLDAQKNGAEELDMELPEVKDYKPRKKLGVEVIEQEVYGIDPYTHNLLLDSMPEELDWTLADKHLFIEDTLLCTLNRQVRHFTGTGNTPMVYSLQPVIEEIERAAEEDHDMQAVRMCQGILRAIDSRPEDKYVAYRKGLGVVCDKEGGFGEDDFVVEFLGEVYPTWKWFEKQDGIRSLQKNNKEPAPEFYNIYLERPKGDADGYDLVVVDAMHKANYASRICHSCRPNCEAKVTAVDGQYQIGIYSTRKIQFGEEITFDYNSVTESKEEYEASVCLCGSQVCRGSYLNLTGEGSFQKVLKEWHGLLDRHQLMLEACELNAVSEDDYYDLARAGLGSCLLGGLPDWLIAYSARLVRFINIERTKLPEEILRHNLEEKRKYFLEISLEVEKSDAEVQAEGVYNQRLQNLAITLDKVRYVMRCIFGDPKQAPPPLVRLSLKEVVSFLWKGEGSVVEELLECIAPHMDDDTLNSLKSNIRDHDPSNSENVWRELKKSLLWLRDEIRNLPCTCKCRHDAAADLIHVYAYTKHFFRIQAYKTATSPPVYISPLDLGPKTSEKLGAGLHEYCKTYGENYCLGQLIFWHIQTYTEPDNTLFRASRGCLSLPDLGSFYATFQKPSRQRVYGPRTVRSMLARMEKQPQRPWPKDQIWTFKSCPKVFGSPMLDAVLDNSPLDREMVNWLKNRPAVFQAMWDQ